MRLYLHCGYHKTGSSFLQTVFAQKNEYLIKNGIYFPLAREDRNMLDAKISPGNGIKLVYSLRESDEDYSLELLKGWINEANSKNCSSLLISAEGLFHTFSKENTLKLLCDSCNKLGIDNIKCLLFFRDPIKHAFSVYKHRGKYGKILDFKNWINEDYETLNLTKDFLDIYNNFNISWHLRRYTSDSSQLIDIVFNDWLELPPPEIVEEKRVNTSLTLSEILALTEAKKLVSYYSIKEIYDSLIQLSNSEKAKDTVLNKYYSNVAYHSLSKHNEVINKVNSVLPDNEKLEFKDVDITSNSNKKQLSLSIAQLNIFLYQIKKASSFQRENFLFFKSKIKRVLSFFRK